MKIRRASGKPRERRGDLRKNLRVTVILLNRKRFPRTVCMPAGKLMTPDGADKVLKLEAGRVEEFFPGLDFRLVPLSDGSFNFVEIPKALEQAAGFAAAAVGIPCTCGAGNPGTAPHREDCPCFMPEAVCV